MMKEFLYSGNKEGIRKMLTENPALASEGIGLPDDNPVIAHPLHRICDAVCNNHIKEETGIEIAKIFLAFGADVNGYPFKEKQDTPLIAACSLKCDQLAILYIDKGANIFPAGCHGGTALHWASWCGRDLIVDRLIREGAEINRLCIDFKSTPLFWAIHGWRFGGDWNRHNQPACMELLVRAGADKSIPNFEGWLPKDLATENEEELATLLS